MTGDRKFYGFLTGNSYILTPTDGGDELHFDSGPSADYWVRCTGGGVVVTSVDPKTKLPSKQKVLAAL